jgi:hypothetical protein
MLIDILLALALGLMIGVPIVIVFDKWKKEMEAEVEELARGLEEMKKESEGDE